MSSSIFNPYSEEFSDFVCSPSGDGAASGSMSPIDQILVTLGLHQDQAQAMQVQGDHPNEMPSNALADKKDEQSLALLYHPQSYHPHSQVQPSSFLHMPNSIATSAAYSINGAQSMFDGAQTNSSSILYSNSLDLSAHANVHSAERYNLSEESSTLSALEAHALRDASSALKSYHSSYHQSKEDMDNAMEQDGMCGSALINAATLSSLATSSSGALFFPSNSSSALSSSALVDSIQQPVQSSQSNSAPASVLSNTRRVLSEPTVSGSPTFSSVSHPNENGASSSSSSPHLSPSHPLYRIRRSGAVTSGGRSMSDAVPSSASASGASQSSKGKHRGFFEYVLQNSNIRSSREVKQAQSQHLQTPFGGNAHAQSQPQRLRKLDSKRRSDALCEVQQQPRHTPCSPTPRQTCSCCVASPSTGNPSPFSAATPSSSVYGHSPQSTTSKLDDYDGNADPILCGHTQTLHVNVNVTVPEVANVADNEEQSAQNKRAKGIQRRFSAPNLSELDSENADGGKQKPLDESSNMQMNNSHSSGNLQQLQYPSQTPCQAQTASKLALPSNLSFQPLIPDGNGVGKMLTPAAVSRAATSSSPSVISAANCAVLTSAAVSSTGNISSSYSYPSLAAESIRQHLLQHSYHNAQQSVSGNAMLLPQPITAPPSSSASASPSCPVSTSSTPFPLESSMPLQVNSENASAMEAIMQNLNSLSSIISQSLARVKAAELQQHQSPMSHMHAAMLPAIASGNSLQHSHAN